MSVRSDMLRRVRSAVVGASCCVLSACSGAHSAADAGEVDAAGLDGTVVAADAPVLDAAGSDSATSATDSSSDVGSTSSDAFEAPDVFVCRASNDVCTFGEDCCSGACILKPGGDGICV
jgi:hypothetical protein